MQEGNPHDFQSWVQYTCVVARTPLLPLPPGPLLINTGPILGDLRLEELLLVASLLVSNPP